MQSNSDIVSRKAALLARRNKLSSVKQASLERRLQSGLSDSVERAISRQVHTGPVPVSFAQQRLWFLQQLEPDSAAYNIPLTVRLNASIRQEALQQALSEVVRRHESLRTSFASREGNAEQIIHQAAPLPLTIADFSGLDESVKQPAAQLVMRQEARRGFDLERGPVIRAAVIATGEQSKQMMVTMHHIVSDGWSSEILKREVSQLYEEYGEGKASPLKELEIQYADYAAWQREYLQGEVLEEEMRYWRKQLSGAPAVLEMPTDRPRTVERSRAGGSVEVKMSREVSQQIETESRKQAATVYMVLMASFKLLLSRYVGKSDIVVGTPVAGRSRVEVEGLIGFFVNTLVMRTEVSEEESFEEMVKRVKQRVIEGQMHQEMPFEKLVEEMQAGRSLSHSPLFQVMFSYNNTGSGSRATSSVAAESSDRDKSSSSSTGLATQTEGLEQGNQLSNIHPASAEAKFDLTLALSQAGQEIAGCIEYNAQLYDEQTVRRIARHYQQLLERVLQQPQIPLRQISLLSQGELQQILREWNATGQEYDRRLTIHELFQQQVEQRGDAVAVVTQDHRISYAQLNGRANQLARYLRGKGVGAEQLVGICLSRSIEMVVAMMAVLKAGGGYVPMDPNYPAERLGYMAQDSGMKVILAQQTLADELCGQQAEIIKIDEQWQEIGEQSEEELSSLSGAENVAYVIYTSGSTGKPKGVAIEHRNTVGLVKWSERVYEQEQMKGVMAGTSICFDLSVFELFVTLCRGGKVVLAENALELVGMRTREEVRMINTVPSAMKELLRMKGVPESVKVVNLAGEALQKGLAEQSYEAGRVEAVWNLYGPTEDTTYSTSWLVKKKDERVPAIGRAVSNTRLYIVDQRQAVAAIGVMGELCIGGEGLSRGYVGRAEKTAEKYVPDPYSEEAGGRMYLTGDICRWRAEGAVEYVGRKDNQVKVRGYRIELGEVEEALLEQAKVREAVVVAQETEGGDKRLVGYVVCEQGVEASEQTGQADEQREIAEMKRRLKQRLPEYMVPTVIVKLDEMPQTPNGKVDRARLPKVEQIARSESETEEKPATQTEQIVEMIWAEVLKVERVGRKENFFEMGGHSLLATRVVSRVRESFKVEMGVREVFERPTIEEMAEEIDKRIKGSSRRGEVGAEAELRRVSRGEEGMRVSYAQQRLWFLQQLEPDSAAYNIPLTVGLNASIKQEALQQALSEVVRRHESLRTSFASREGNAEQIIHQAAPLPLTIADLSGLDESVKQPAAQLVMRQEARRGFDLERGPVIRAAVIATGEQSKQMMVTMHHIVSDGWSSEILKREVSQLYEEYGEGKASPLKELEIQYADYAAWQREYLQGEVLEEEMRYWRKQLSGAPAVLEMPTDRPRTAARSNRGGVVAVRVSHEAGEKLRRISRQEGATMYMALMAIYKVMLRRYTGKSDIVVGIPVAGRTRMEVEGLIGFFVNTLVMRTEVEDEESYRQLLRRVRGIVLEGQSHAEVPFERLVEELSPDRSLSHSPLFQVIFSMNANQNEIAGGTKTDGIEEIEGEREREGVSVQGAKFDLTLSLEEVGGEIRGGMEYRSDLYDEETIKRMAQHFENLVESVAKNADSKVRELEMMSVQERMKIAQEWNDTSREYDTKRSIIELIEEQAERDAGAIAVVKGDEQLSYGELNKRANQLSRYLKGKGVRAEHRVGICVERSVDMVVGLLGILKAGGAYVPMDAAYPMQRLAYLMEDAQISLLITQEHLLAILPESEAGILRIDSEWSEIAKESHQNPEREITGENLAYVIYTSGSTGQPKGAQIEHRSLMNLIFWHIDQYNVTQSDRATQLASIGFDAAVWEIWPYLAAGACLRIADDETRISAESLRDWLQEEEVTICFQPTPLAERFVEERWSEKGKLRYALTGGDRLRRYKGEGRSYELVNHYGPTEHTVVATAAVVEEAGEGVPTIGRAIANTQVYILDERHNLTPIGVAGELCISGDGLARGYLNQSEMTAEKFIPNLYGKKGGARLYRTGDLARFKANGEIEYLGRIDHQVKVRGYRIELGEIEAALADEEGIKQSVVIAIEEQGENRLIGYVEEEDGRQMDERVLKARLRQRLPDHMVPSVIVKLDEIPLTPNGKVDRRSLPLPAYGNGAMGSARVKPQTETQRRLVEVWEATLGLSPVGITDDFFRLGGHSFLAVRMKNLIEQKLGRKVTLAQLFQQPTVEQMAAFLDEQPSGALRTALVNLQPHGSKRPLFFVHPSGGQVSCYVELAREMDPERPFYGFQARGLDGEAAPYDDVEAMATHYVDLLLEAEPHGPYLLGGWSMGGIVAYEMAQQLIALGKRVGLLALIDSHAPSRETWRADELTLLHRYSYDLGLQPRQHAVSKDALQHIHEAERLEYILSQAKKFGRVPRSVTLTEFDHFFGVFKANIQAMRNYAPRKYAGRVTLFRAGDAAYIKRESIVRWLMGRLIDRIASRRKPSRAEATIGWERWAKQGVESYTLPGDHYSLVAQPNVVILAERIRQCLRAAEENGL